ncbi:G1 family glutamic endopeptidase [Lentzea aerocolonigenes]|uniref:G1 family glutamic endopeptidase n=1 Tax=Lentzea aerocolonigenes TaxID=68170 RepID=UPI0006924BD4|nr:G1 family glutamic endopeptidase [Lentzea aerocolonigenes]MCP2241890.1 Peptidase A4 family protein [Lentzea aerocolonigenes]
MHRIAALLAVVVSTVAITPPAWADDSRDAPFWAGYMALRTNGFKYVSATWTVPGATCDADEDSAVAVWVGMGSQTSGENTVDQTGTVTECDDGLPRYRTFAEAYPAKPVYLFDVAPGDTIHARITMGTGKFDYFIMDYDSAEFDSGELATTGRGRSAEVIVEGPKNEPMTRFDRIELRNAKINDIPIGRRDLVHWTMTDPDSSDRKVRAYASRLTDGGRDFNVYFLRP